MSRVVGGHQGSKFVVLNPGDIIFGRRGQPRGLHTGSTSACGLMNVGGTQFTGTLAASGPTLALMSGRQRLPVRDLEMRLGGIPAGHTAGRPVPEDPAGVFGRSSIG